jgi:hypothetical protein
MKLTQTFADRLENRSIEAPHEPVNAQGTLIMPDKPPQAAYDPNSVLAEVKVDPDAPKVSRSYPFNPISFNPPGFTALTPPPQEAPKPKLKVALVGTAPSSRLLAPFNDPTWEIWVCSPGNMSGIPRVSRWFEIHNNYEWPEHASYGPSYLQWLRQQPFPIYMQDQKTVPNATVYPKDDMLKEFGPDFFTSSFAWMMAYAIHLGAEEIALFGIDMASRDEYILQRPGFYYFKHRAEQKGIKVWAPNESDIMQPAPLYGYSEVTPFGRKIIARERELKERIGPMRMQRDQLNQNITYLEGALEDLDYVKSIWMGLG